MPHFARAAAAALVAAALAGCNQAGGPTAAGGPAAAVGPTAAAPSVPIQSSSLPPGVSPPGFALPEGQGCAGDISRFRAVLANDAQIGHLSASVYKRASADVSQADTACAAGRENQARMIVFSARRTYGYP